MKVSFYILQQNDNGQMRELPFMSSLEFGNIITDSLIVKIADINFVVFKIEIHDKFIKAFCKMQFAVESESIDQLFHRFPSIPES